MNDELTIQFYSSEPITVHTCGNMTAHISTTITTQDLFRMLRKLPKEVLLLAIEEVGFKLIDEEVNPNLVEDNEDILGLSTEEKLNLAYQQIKRQQSQIAVLEDRNPVGSTPQVSSSNLEMNDKELKKLRAESEELKKLREEYRVVKKKHGQIKHELDELTHQLKKTYAAKEEKLTKLLAAEKKKKQFLSQYLKDNNIRYQQDYQDFIDNLYLHSRYRTEDYEYEDEMDENSDFWR